MTLMRRIYLVDCPGVVYPTAETPTEFVLKGVVSTNIIVTVYKHKENKATIIKKSLIKKKHA